MQEEFILFKSTGEIVLEAVQLKNEILGAHTQSSEKAVLVAAHGSTLRKD